jgi:hypothetical protein
VGTGHFWTNGIAALAQVTGGGQTRQAMLPQRRVLNTNELATFALNRMPMGNAVRVVLVSRATGTTLTAAQYRLAVTITPTGMMVLTGSRYVAGATTAIGTPVTSALRFMPGTQYSVRARVTGAGSTRLQLRVWPTATTEPMVWAYQGTDGAKLLQRPGSTGLRLMSALGMRGSLTAVYRSFAVFNLDPSVTYSYTVRAVDESGNRSPMSEPRQVMVR